MIRGKHRDIYIDLVSLKASTILLHFFFGFRCLAFQFLPTIVHAIKVIRKTQRLIFFLPDLVVLAKRVRTLKRTMLFFYTE